MTAKPPRASTRSDASKKPRRAATQGGSKLRAASVVPTDQYVKITDDEIVDVLDATHRALPALPPMPDSPVRQPNEPPALRVLILESASHLAAAQQAVVAAGHVVVRGAAGTAGIDKLVPLLGEVDAAVIALPGGEPLLEAVAALGAARPLIIGSITASAVVAARRALGAGADLFVVRPHDVERMAPVLFAASKLVEQRRVRAAPPADGAVDVELDGEHDGELDGALSELDGDADAEHGGGTLQALAAFQGSAERELARCGRYGYPLALAVFSLEVAPPLPPPALRGLLRARTGNALVNAVRDIDLVTDLDGERFAVLLPYTDRLAGAELARRILGAVAAADPITMGGRSYPPKVTGAVVGVTAGGEPPGFDQLLRDATQLLDQAAVTGASLAVET
ncbi:MAG TPA: hypothetical protein VGC42_00700 [Kofleriaceae bacterium]